MTKSKGSKAQSLRASMANPSMARKRSGVKMVQEQSKDAAGPVKVYSVEERAAWAKEHGYSWV
jgi:hypothetical protein